MKSLQSTAFHRFFNWWAAELKALLPRNAFAGRSRSARRLVLSVEGARQRLILEKGAQSETLAEESGESLNELTRFVANKPKLPVGLRFDSQHCFARTIELPAQAEGDFARILELDMERTTPFRAADVLTAYHVVPGQSAPRGKQAVRHLIVKRKTIEPLLGELRDLGIEPAFADCWNEDRSGGLPVNFLARAGQSGKRPGSGLVLILAGLSIVLAVSAGAILMIRHQNALEMLKTQTATARAEAETVRLAVAASQTASARIEALNNLIRKRLPVPRILEELTVMIPDSAWVSDLRINGDVVDLSGFAKSAAALVPILEKSVLFNEVSLTAPVIFDNSQDKERFSLRLRLSSGGAAPAKEASSKSRTGAKL